MLKNKILFSIKKTIKSSKVNFLLRNLGEFAKYSGNSELILEKQ